MGVSLPVINANPTNCGRSTRNIHQLRHGIVLRAGTALLVSRVVAGIRYSDAGVPDIAGSVSDNLPTTVAPFVH
jgi:hypothetical protein